jgi:RNA polymerase sigma-70 factor, ECF subfamily
MPNTTSTNLLDQLLQPDLREEAWDRFVFLYGPMVYRWVWRFGFQSHVDAEDVVQDIFTTLARNFDFDKAKGHKAKGNFRSWLKTIVKRRCAAIRRGEKHLFLIPSPDEIEIEVPDPAEKLLDEEDQADLIHRIVTTMQTDFPATYEPVLAYLKQEGTAQEIAKKYGTTPAAIYMASARIIQRLREDYGGLI